MAESAPLTSRELDPAFVLMQYFGYLQRNPQDAPNTNLDGHNFWLNKLNEFNGDFRHAEMVKSFLISASIASGLGVRDCNPLRKINQREIAVTVLFVSFSGFSVRVF